MKTMKIDLVLRADSAEAYVAKIVAEHLGDDATIDVQYGPPDDRGLVCVIGEAREHDEPGRL